MIIKNYADVKEFVATLTPEQLQEGVLIQVLDESSITVTEMEVNDVDYVYNEDSEGLIPVSEYSAEDFGHDLTDTNYNTIVPAGSRVFAYDDSFGEDDKVTHTIKPYQIIAAMEKAGFTTVDRNRESLLFRQSDVEIRVDEGASLSQLFKNLMEAGVKLFA